MGKNVLSPLFNSLIFSIFFLALSFCTGTAHCAEVTLQWNPVAGADGYKIYYGVEPRIYPDSIDVGNQTVCTLSLDPGTYYLSVTAYNSYGESGYSEEVSFTTPGTDVLYIGQKIRAAGTLGKAYIGCYVRRINNSNFPFEANIAKAEEKFESTWERVEANAANRGETCATAAATAVEDTIFLSIEDLNNQICDGLDLNDRHARTLAKSLLKAIKKKCNALIKAESSDIKKPNADKLQAARDRADRIFLKRWDKAVTKAQKKGVTNAGLSMDDVENAIDNLVLDVLFAMGY